MKVVIFCVLGLEMPTHAPQIGIFEGFDLLMGSNIKSMNPKRYTLPEKHVI